MAQDDGTGTGLREQPVMHLGNGPGGAPVLRVHIPQDRGVAEALVDGLALRQSDGPIRRAVQEGHHAAGLHNGVVRGLQFIHHPRLTHVVELGMRPSVIGHFVAFGDDAFDDVRPGGGAFADEEERGLDVALLEQVEQARGELRMRAIVKGDGDDLAWHMGLRVRDLGLWRQGARQFFDINDRFGIRWQRRLDAHLRR